MGHQTQDIYALLSLIFELGADPTTAAQPWVADAIRQGLRHRDPELRELAIAAAAVLGRAWLPELFALRNRERTPWLLRLVDLVLDDARAMV